MDLGRLIKIWRPYWRHFVVCWSCFCQTNLYNLLSCIELWINWNWNLGSLAASSTLVSCILSKTSDVIWKICISQSNGKLSPTSTFLKCETKILMVINGCPVLWWIRRMWMCLLKNSSLNLEKVCISISRAYLCFSIFA